MQLVFCLKCTVLARAWIFCIAPCFLIRHWMLSIVRAFIIRHCCMTSTSSASRFLSLRRLGDVGRLKNGVFMQEIAIVKPTGSLLKRIGYHHWRRFKLYMIDCRPHQACICIPGSLSVPGYGHIMSSIGKSQVVFDSELLTQPVVYQLFCVHSGIHVHDLARSFVDG